ncbi:MAG: rhamnulokinase [Chloroflexi bacterium]|nr:rhamnulokinase [Chloroflexota bacterium]
MTARKTVLAVDLGAESGRIMAAHFDGTQLHLEELHRFTNSVTLVRGTMHWDILHLWRSIQQGIELGKKHHPTSLGVDTWAIDFGLLDAQGSLIANPVCYRDSRTNGMMDAAFAKVSQREIFEQTGIQFMPINTLYQLLSLVEAQSPVLEIAQTFLTIPDLLNYWLTGVKACEFTNATTTQMLNPRSGQWANDMLNRLGIPTKILPEIVPPGTKLGAYEGIPVIAPATHDTGSAVAAVPTQKSNYAYISSGTWSLVGLEVGQAVITDESFAANVTNEGGVAGTYRLLKNVMGLWIIQQCRATWAAQGQEYSYAELVKMARQVAPLRSVFDVDDGRFLAPGDHPQHIRDWCVEYQQPVPDSVGAVVRCVLESLAQKYRTVIERLQAISGQAVEVIHIVGGGTQNELLNQLTADATGIPVVSGPIEATVLGNAVVQLMAQGEIGSLQEARQLLANMGLTKTYMPQNTGDWH